jgi:lipoprotein NlpD
MPAVVRVVPVVFTAASGCVIGVYRAAIAAGAGAPLRFVALLWLGIMLGACSSGGPWKPDDRWPPRSATSAAKGQYTVKKGDTLYSIAFRYGMNYRELAAINHIGPPYTIRVGQTLRLSAPAQTAARQSAGATKARSHSTGTGVAVIGGGAATTSAAKAASSAPTNTGSGAATPAASSRAAAAGATARASTAPVVWTWPARGPVIGRFSDGPRVNKGIDIGGKLGDSVHSTRSGVVVYAGSGLSGYGNLVIIKHDDVYLSAYAHNKTILVREGQTVKAGEQIAEIGSSGSAYPKLHFEIRRDGKPVDPLQLLPRR